MRRDQGSCRAVRHLATDSLGTAWTLHGYLVNPGIAASSLLDPSGFAHFEAELLSALDGLHGLAAAGARCAALDGELRAAAFAYESADELGSAERDTILGLVHAPQAALAAAATLTRTHNPILAVDAAVTADPEMTDVLVDGLGVPGLLNAVAGAIPDRHGVPVDLGADTSTPGRTPPRGVADVVRDLARCDADPRHAVIDVRILTMADGTRRAMVDITGTKNWSLALRATSPTWPPTSDRWWDGRPRTRVGCSLPCGGPASARRTTS